MQNIIVATIKEWNILNYFILKEKFCGSYIFYLISSNDELTFKLVNKLKPKYIFFPHWSWKISEDIYTNYECVVFHMSDLPYGRGGSPLQNLILNAVYNTKISALKVDEDFDTGDIYLKEDLDISEGNAQEIFTNASKIIFEIMIPKFLTSNLISTTQIGKVVNFKRRTPQESDINTLKEKSLTKIYDFIRMLDADSYPKAYIMLDNFKITYSDVKKEGSKLVGKFEILEDDSKKTEGN